MRNKELVLDKLERLETDVKQLDRLYNSATSMYEKNQIYDAMLEKIGDIKTLINTEFEE